MKRLAGYIASALADLLNKRGASPESRYRISAQGLEQRRSAARASASSRAEKAERARKRKAQRIRTTNPERNTQAETITSTDSVPTKATESGKPLSSDVFLQYAAAFKLRYGVFPVRNAKINGMLGKYMQRVPHAEAAEIAAFYVAHNRGLYTNASHPIELLLRDAESLRMEWATGRKTVTKINGQHAVSVSQAWWESWSGLVEQGNELGIDEGDNPTVYRFEVLRAAFKAGRLPDEVAIKLGVGDGRAD